MNSLICSRCNEKTSGSEVVFVSSDRFVCKSCYAFFSKPKVLDATLQDKEKYFCVVCRNVSVFKITSSVVRRCQFCGSSNLEVKKPFAAKLLEE